MQRPAWSPTAEQYTVIAIAISVCAAAIAASVPALRFGSFQHMAAILIASDVVLYVLLKLGVIRGLRAG